MELLEGREQAQIIPGGKNHDLPRGRLLFLSLFWFFVDFCWTEKFSFRFSFDVFFYFCSGLNVGNIVANKPYQQTRFCQSRYMFLKAEIGMIETNKT